MTNAKTDPTAIRTLVARAFTLVEDSVYVGLGLLLSVSAVVLLGHAAVTGARDLMNGQVPGAIIGLLDRALLMLRRRHPDAVATRA